VTEIERPAINRDEGSTLAFSKAQARKLLDLPKPETEKGEPIIEGLRDRAILSVGLQVGLRRAEIAALRVGDLHQNRGFDSLRRTKDDNIILCAVNVEQQEPRSYRIERILGATILNRGFAPRYRIELTPSGPLVAPDTPRGGKPAPRQPPATRRRAGNAWPKTTYLYRCPVCGKRFERSSMDPTLRAHKNPAGEVCGGRQGIYEGAE